MSRRDRESALLTLLFTDIVSSTEIAGEMGDRRWRELLRRHNEIVRRELQRFGGREIDTAGDGFFATFDRPAQAIRAAWAISDAVRRLGIEIRAGLHLGEAEVIGSSVRGVAVHVGARVASAAGPGEVLVSETLKAVVPGSGFRFEDRGVHQLKGVPEPQRLLSVAAVVGSDRSPPLSDEEASKRRELIEAPAPVYRRRRPLLVVGAAVLVGAAVALVLVLGGDRGPVDPSPSLAPEPRNEVLRIDASTGEVLERIGGLPPRTFRFGQAPFSELVVGEGSVWVDNGAGGNVTQIDLESGEIERTIPLTAILTEDIAVTEGVEAALWVTRRTDVGGPPPVARVSPGSGRVVADIGIGRLRIAGLALSAGEGAVWILEPGEGAVIRIDPETNEAGDRIELPSGAGDAFVAGEGGVWAAADFENVVYRVDPRTERVVETIDVSGGVTALEAGDGYVWGLNQIDGRLLQIDPGSNHVIHTVPIGGEPEGLAVGDGVVWVTDPSDGSVSRVNVSTLEVERFEVGNHPEGIAVDGDDVWVIVRPE